ncbi:MAG TPA: DUF359 domain-containing protein [Candidatus Bilamarchaeaceae archaeon]|nr:DUF359 domain-containing protein [Candidatus Bilamarchaeaceae archaeon]
MPLVKGRKIISVGDQATYSLLRMGIRPHLSAFDFRTMRGPVSREVREVLEKEYPRPKTFKNPAGTISEELFSAAPALMRGGGSILIDGEEDLVAIPFIFFLGKGYVVIYGQPGEGCVLVSSSSAGRGKIRKIAEALGLAPLRD